MSDDCTRIQESLVEVAGERGRLDADERALIFTQYREMGELLVAHVAQTHEVRATFLHGGLSRSARDRAGR